MKLLHVIASMNPDTGGPSQGIRNSIPELEKHNVYREIICLDDPSSKYLGMDDFIIHAIGGRKTAWQYSAKLSDWLYHNICRFDIVIVNGLWLYPNYAVRKILLRLHKEGKQDCPRYFIMPHGMLDPYFQSASHRKLKAIRNWIYWKLIESINVKQAKALLFTCQRELELARLSFNPYKPNKEINVGYGIAEPPEFTETMKEAFYSSCKEIRNKPYFIFLSRIDTKKGVDLLLYAYHKILAESMILDIPNLVIAGPGLESQYGKGISMIVNKHDQLKEHVFFAGMLSGDAKWGALYCSDAFILPSHQENFGIAIVEALACGKVALITNKVNIWKEIYQSNAGFVEEDNIDGTYLLFYKWLQLNKIEKDKMCINAKECYQNNFSIKKAAQKFLEAIHS